MITVYNTPQDQDPIKRIQQSVEYQRKYFDTVEKSKEEPDTWQTYKVTLKHQPTDPDDFFPKIKITLKNLADQDIAFPEKSMKVDEQKFAEEGDYQMVTTGELDSRVERITKRFKGVPSAAQIADSRKMNEYDGDGNPQPERVNLQTDPAYGLDGSIMPGERPPEDFDEDGGAPSQGGNGGGDGGGYGGGPPPPSQGGGGGFDRFVRSILRPLNRDPTTPRRPAQASSATPLTDQAEARLRRQGYDEIPDRRPNPRVSVDISNPDDESAPLLTNNRSRRRSTSSTVYGTPVGRDSTNSQGDSRRPHQEDVFDQATSAGRRFMDSIQRSLRSVQTNIERLPEDDEEVVIFNNTARNLDAYFRDNSRGIEGLRRLANHLARFSRQMEGIDYDVQERSRDRPRRQRVRQAFERLGQAVARREQMRRHISAQTEAQAERLVEHVQGTIHNMVDRVASRGGSADQGGSADRRGSADRGGSADQGGSAAQFQTPPPRQRSASSPETPIQREMTRRRGVSDSTPEPLRSDLERVTARNAVRQFAQRYVHHRVNPMPVEQDNREVVTSLVRDAGIRNELVRNGHLEDINASGEQVRRAMRDAILEADPVRYRRERRRTNARDESTSVATMSYDQLRTHYMRLFGSQEARREAGERRRMSIEDFRPVRRSEGGEGGGRGGSARGGSARGGSARRGSARGGGRG